MRRAAAVLLLALSACGERVSDFSGRWLMSETDPECAHAYSRCWVEIEQRGDRVTLRARGEGGDWTCDGRGEVLGKRLRFRWLGERKNWRGWAEVERTGDELRGTYGREDVSAPGVQYCKGTKAAAIVK